MESFLLSQGHLLRGLPTLTSTLVLACRHRELLAGGLGRGIEHPCGKSTGVMEVRGVTASSRNP